MMMEIEQHFVTFNSPGTFVAEATTKSIASWDVDAARAMMANIIERYSSRPYGFYFSTQGRNADDLDSKETARSGFYYVGGKVETLDDVIARDDPKESILRGNMEINKWHRIWTSTTGWKWTQPLCDDDVVLPELELVQ
jgi:hypothetical protein